MKLELKRSSSHLVSLCLVSDLTQDLKAESGNCFT